MDARPHAKNAPGDYYVVDGCCTACGIPEGEAPTLFTFDESSHCYVKKQPCAREETERMLRAMWAAELDCIRYAGNDPAIFKRLGEMGKADLCDSPPPEGIPVVLRNHVEFRSLDGQAATLEQVVSDFGSFWLQREGRKFLGPKRGLLRRDTWFEIAWYEDRYHRIYVSHVELDRSRFCMFHSSRETFSSRGISDTLREWIAQSACFGRQQCFTADGWLQRSGASDTPW